MKTLTTTLALTILALGAAGADAADSGSDRARYAVAKVSNPLDRTLQYKYRWGDGAWKTATIDPGVTQRHSWRYQFAGQNTSPRLQVRFDADIGEGVFFKTYTLLKHAVRLRTIGGKHYRFRYSVPNRILKLSTAN